MLRTTCFGVLAPITITWIESIPPVASATIRADTTSCRVDNNSSAFFSGSTDPAILSGCPGCAVTFFQCEVRFVAQDQKPTVNHQPSAANDQQETVFLFRTPQ